MKQSLAYDPPTGPQGGCVIERTERGPFHRKAASVHPGGPVGGTYAITRLHAFRRNQVPKTQRPGRKKVCYKIEYEPHSLKESGLAPTRGLPAIGGCPLAPRPARAGTRQQARQNHAEKPLGIHTPAARIGLAGPNDHRTTALKCRRSGKISNCP